jgi:RNA polymerase sigma-70 factor, ECF subfamily
VRGALESKEARFNEAVELFGAALERLASAYEADAEKRRDLNQEIHLQLWRSFERFDGRCSLRTWVYRVAHNTAASHAMRERRRFLELATLEQLDRTGDFADPQQGVDLERLRALVRQLKPLDRQIIVSYLEDLDAASIAEITGLTPAHVAMKVHRIKKLLAKRFQGQNGG